MDFSVFFIFLILCLPLFLVYLSTKSVAKDESKLGIIEPIPDGNFTGPIDVRMVKILSSAKFNRMIQKDGAVILRDVKWQIIYGDDSDTVTVPAGSVTDGASVPRLFWFISGNPKFGATAAAAYVHDILYGFHRTDQGRHISRAEADKIFRDALVVLGLKKYKAWLCWLGLRVGGRSAYYSQNSSKPWAFSQEIADEVRTVRLMLKVAQIAAAKPDPDPDCFCECCNTKIDH